MQKEKALPPALKKNLFFTTEASQHQNEDSGELGRRACAGTGQQAPRCSVTQLQQGV